MFSLFTDLPMDEIRELIKKDIVLAKKKLCFEITKFVRGEEDAILAKKMSENLFTHGGDDAPIFEMKKEEFDAGVNICEVLNRCGLCSSKSDARRMIEGGGIQMNGQKVSDIALNINSTHFKDNSILLKKGKKNFIKVIIK